MIGMKAVHFLQYLLCGILASMLVGCSQLARHDLDGWYRQQKAVMPRDRVIVVCHAFGCARRKSIVLNDVDLANMKTVLQAGHQTAQDERFAIAKLIQWYELRVASAVGSGNDIGGLDLWNAGVAGQLDCIDEATNTTSILLIAQKHGFLHHYKVGRPVARGFFLDGRYPHATATIIEQKGDIFAVDSWQRANGQLPVIQPIHIWFSRRTSS